MKPSAKAVPAPSRKKRASRAKPVNKDLAQLATALESAKALKLSPPETSAPRHDPAMWSRLFGMWS